MATSIKTIWSSSKTRDLCDVGRGSSPRPIADQRYFEGGHIPWIKIADATKSGKFLYETKEYVNEYGASFSRLLPAGTIIVAASGTLGYTQILGIPGCAHDGWLILTNLRNFDRDYAYYVLQQMQRHFYNSAYGAAIQNINTEILRETEIPCPPLPIQRKIASILSAYDDLIENNSRRIKILEEMAQNLHREWFVKFRFPGHEKARMVDSPLGKIPEGWDVTTLDSVLSILESGSRPKGGIDPSMRDVPSIGAENILGLGKYDFSKEKFVSREFFEKMKRGHINNCDVLLYKDGAKIGRKSMFRDNFPHSECCINEHVFIFRTNEKCGQAYLFFWLDQPDITAGIINLNANAAQPGINQQGVKGLPILLPDRKSLDLFDEFVEPLLAKLFNLAKKNQVLRRTPDLLLPKLISGELDVSDLDIRTGGHMQ